MTLLSESPAILRCTEDTTMALALAEHLADRLERGGELDEDDLEPLHPRQEHAAPRLVTLRVLQ